MGLCGHCLYSAATRYMQWRYPRESYVMCGLLCDACAQQVRIRHTRGFVHQIEDMDVDEWASMVTSALAPVGKVPDE